MVENIEEHLPFRRQAGLKKSNDIITESRPLLDGAHLGFAYITSIDHTRGLVALTTGADHTVNGHKPYRHPQRAQLPVERYGINSHGHWYGEFPSVAVGNRVLIGYIGGVRNMPIVLGIYPSLHQTKEHLAPTSKSQGPETMPLTDTFWSHKKVLPSQQVGIEKGHGDFERSFNGYSFIACLDSSDKWVPPWYHRNWTGMKDMKHGYGFLLDCFRDPKTEKQYKLYKRAQDMMLVNQSNMPYDKHLTKLMVDHNGDFHGLYNDRQLPKDVLLTNYSCITGISQRKQHDTTGHNSKDYSEYRMTDSSRHIALTDRKNSIIPYNPGAKGYDGQHTNQLMITPKQTWLKAMGHKLEINRFGIFVDGVLITSRKDLKQLSDKVITIQNNVQPIINQINNFSHANGFNHNSGIGDLLDWIKQQLANLANQINDLLSRFDTLSEELGDLQGLEQQDSDTINQIVNNIHGNKWPGVSNIYDWENMVNNDIVTLFGLDGHSGDINDLYNKLKEISNSLKHVPTNDQLNKLQSDMNNKFNKIQSEISSLANRVGNLEKDDVTFKKEISDLEARVRHLENQDTNLERTIDSMTDNQGHLPDYSDDIKKLWSQVDSNSTHINNNQQLEQGNQSQVGDLSTKYSNLVALLKSKGIVKNDNNDV